MKELMGGLWFAGLLAWALMGLMPGLVLLVLGAMTGAGELVRERQAEKQAASWRRTYPPYGY
jgi:hypothetical protein